VGLYSHWVFNWFFECDAPGCFLGDLDRSWEQVFLDVIFCFVPGGICHNFAPAMDNEIGNAYIEDAIEELVNAFGIKEPIPSSDIFDKIMSNQVKEAMKIIAQQLGLPIDVRIINVPVDYRSQQGDNQFKSAQLTRTNGHGTAGIIAQVLIPDSLPFYGSPSLKGYLVNVKISEGCTENPMVFIKIMAHEFSHVLLYSLNHPKKENEFYTDLTAMVLGFADVFRDGRKTTETISEFGNTITTRTCTYGYLNDRQFDFAFNKIYAILETRRKENEPLSRLTIQFGKTLSEYEKALCKFKEYLDFLSKNTHIKISSAHGKRITEFFQPGYMENIEASINNRKKRLENIRIFLSNPMHFTSQQIELIKNSSRELTLLLEELNQSLSIIKKDIKMLKKYLRFKYWLHVFFSRFFKRCHSS